jgi:hypothetical protein
LRGDQVVELTIPVRETNEQPLRVGGEVKAPVVVHRPALDITPCTRDGTVTNARLLKAIDPCLDALYVEDVQGWRFHPATYRGKPVAVLMNFTIRVEYR